MRTADVCVQPIGCLDPKPLNTCQHLAATLCRQLHDSVARPPRVEPVLLGAGLYLCHRAGRGEQRHAANLAAELLVDVPLNTRRVAA